MMTGRLPDTARMALCGVVLASAGCVTKGTYQNTVDELDQARIQHQATLQEERAARERERQTLQRELAELQAELTRTQAELARAERDAAGFRDRLGSEVDARARLQENLRQTDAEAETLRRQVEALSAIEAEVRSRNRIYEDMIGRFRGLIDAGRLSVSIINGRMVLQLPQDVLFPSGSATLNSEGSQTLTEIGQVLAGIEDRKFQVEGHTDNVPISTQRFPSNWELSSGRALAVVQLLLSQGVNPDNLSGAAYGEHQPVSSNETPEGRRLNRRIEIVMLPNLDVISEFGSGGTP